jgi:hypothetical protein
MRTGTPRPHAEATKGTCDTFSPRTRNTSTPIARTVPSTKQHRCGHSPIQ